MNLFIKELLTEYTILVTGIFGVIAYTFSQRKKKYERYYTYLDNNISKIISPLFHDLRKIVHCNDSYMKIVLITDFFRYYSDRDSKIYQISNREILEKYYELEENLNCFNKGEKKDTEFLEEINIVFRSIIEFCAILYEIIKPTLIIMLLYFITIIKEYREFVVIYVTIFEFLLMMLVLCLSILGANEYFRFKKKQRREGLLDIIIMKIKFKLKSSFFKFKANK